MHPTLNNRTMIRSIAKTAFTTTLLLLFVFVACKKKNTQSASNTGSSTTRGNSTTTGNTTTGNTTTTGGSTTGGNTPIDHKDSLTGTTWVLYQYRDEYTTTPLPRTDTLIFIDAGNYTWNGLQQTYSLKTQDNIYNKYVFSLNNTPFGTLRGLIPLTMKQYGEVINEPFSQTAVSSPQTFFLWFRKIH